MALPAKVLITGGNGFIGRRVVAKLRDRAVTVTIFDDGSAGMPNAAGVTVIRGDIRDTDAVTAVLAQADADAIVHLAALHHIPTCNADPRRALDINVVGTQTLLDAAAAQRVGTVVLASSGAVYDWHDRMLDEEAPVRARDIYATCKLANEQQLAIWADAHGRRGRIARLFNVIGPGDPNGHLVPDILGRLAAIDIGSTGCLRLGGLDRRRDYIDVEDAADGIVALIANADAAPISVYNLCSGIETSVQQMAEKLARTTGRQIVCESDPTLVRRQDRPSQLGSFARAASCLGWRPASTLDDTLKRIVAIDGRFTR